jgi:hypothetical protein
MQIICAFSDVCFYSVLKFHPERLAECEEAALKLTQSASSFLNSLLSPKQNATKVVTGLQMLTGIYFQTLPLP